MMAYMIAWFVKFAPGKLHSLSHHRSSAQACGPGICRCHANRPNGYVIDPDLTQTRECEGDCNVSIARDRSIHDKFAPPVRLMHSLSQRLAPQRIDNHQSVDA